MICVQYTEDWSEAALEGTTWLGLCLERTERFCCKEDMYTEDGKLKIIKM